MNAHAIIFCYVYCNCDINDFHDVYDEKFHADDDEDGMREY